MFKLKNLFAACCFLAFTACETQPFKYSQNDPFRSGQNGVVILQAQNLVEEKDFQYAYFGFTLATGNSRVQWIKPSYTKPTVLSLPDGNYIMSHFYMRQGRKLIAFADRFTADLTVNAGEVVYVGQINMVGRRPDIDRPEAQHLSRLPHGRRIVIVAAVKDASAGIQEDIARIERETGVSAQTRLLSIKDATLGKPSPQIIPAAP